MEDLGSGTFIDFSKYGMIKEPTVQESIATGVDVVTFSGDKLLGGPQAGIILGKKSILDKIKKNPLTRALRIDKMTLAALEITMRLYRDEKKAVKSIPTLCMLTTPFNIIEKRAQKLKRSLTKLDNPSLHVDLLNRSSRAGGGSLPLMDLPSKCIGIKVAGISANKIEKSMRNNSPAIIGRIEEDIFIMDLRTILDDQLPIIKDALQAILERVL
jgi:L-seryl-tRNA(Ser) seleniumtransferase